MFCVFRVLLLDTVLHCLLAYPRAVLLVERDLLYTYYVHAIL